MNDKSRDIEEAISKGEKRLVERHPELFDAAAQITDDIADALGTSKLDLQAVELRKSIAGFARLNGEEVNEMLISIGADSPAEADRLLAKRRSGIQKAMGQ